MWVGLNVIPVTVGSFLVAYLEPVAGGSGIPQVGVRARARATTP